MGRITSGIPGLEDAWVPNSLSANHCWDGRLLLHRWIPGEGWQFHLFGSSRFTRSYWASGIRRGAIIHTQSVQPVGDCWLFHEGGDVEWIG